MFLVFPVRMFWAGVPTGAAPVEGISFQRAHLPVRDACPGVISRGKVSRTIVFRIAIITIVYQDHHRSGSPAARDAGGFLFNLFIITQLSYTLFTKVYRFNAPVLYLEKPVR